MNDPSDFTELLEELLADYDYKLISIDTKMEDDPIPVYIIGSNTPTYIPGPRKVTLNISAIQVKP